MQRLIGKSGEDAIKEFSYAYKEFSVENKTGYGLYVNVLNTKD